MDFRLFSSFWQSSLPHCARIVASVVVMWLATMMKLDASLSLTGTETRLAAHGWKERVSGASKPIESVVRANFKLAATVGRVPKVGLGACSPWFETNHGTAFICGTHTHTPVICLFGSSLQSCSDARMLCSTCIRERLDWSILAGSDGRSGGNRFFFLGFMPLARSFRLRLCASRFIG